MNATVVGGGLTTRRRASSANGLTRDRELMAYPPCRLLVLHGHDRGEEMIEELWASSDAPWRTWHGAAPLALAR